MSIKATKYSITNKASGKPDFVTYEIDVSVAGQSWTILRRFGQLKTVDTWVS